MNHLLAGQVAAISDEHLMDGYQRSSGQPSNSAIHALMAEIDRRKLADW